MSKIKTQLLMYAHKGIKEAWSRYNDYLIKELDLNLRVDEQKKTSKLILNNLLEDIANAYETACILYFFNKLDTDLFIVLVRREIIQIWDNQAFWSNIDKNEYTYLSVVYHEIKK